MQDRYTKTPTHLAVLRFEDTATISAQFTDRSTVDLTQEAAQLLCFLLDYEHAGHVDSADDNIGVGDTIITGGVGE